MTPEQIEAFLVEYRRCCQHAGFRFALPPDVKIVPITSFQDLEKTMTGLRDALVKPAAKPAGMPAPKPPKPPVATKPKTA